MGMEKNFLHRRETGLVLGALIVLSGCKVGERVVSQEETHFVSVTVDTLKKLGLNNPGLLKKVQFRTDSSEFKAAEDVKSDTLEVQVVNGVVQQKDKQSPVDTLVIPPNTLLELVDTSLTRDGKYRFILRGTKDGDIRNNKVLTFVPDSSGTYRLAYGHRDSTIIYGDETFKVDPSANLPRLEFATRKTNTEGTNKSRIPEGKNAPKGVNPTKPIKIVRTRVGGGMGGK